LLFEARTRKWREWPGKSIEPPDVDEAGNDRLAEPPDADEAGNDRPAEQPDADEAGNDRPAERRSKSRERLLLG
jgi:hypothetical protein